MRLNARWIKLRESIFFPSLLEEDCTLHIMYIWTNRFKPGLMQCIEVYFQSDKINWNDNIKQKNQINRIYHMHVMATVFHVFMSCTI